MSSYRYFSGFYADPKDDALAKFHKISIDGRIRELSEKFYQRLYNAKLNHHECEGINCFILKYDEKLQTFNVMFREKEDGKVIREQTMTIAEFSAFCYYTPEEIQTLFEPIHTQLSTAQEKFTENTGNIQKWKKELEELSDRIYYLEKDIEKAEDKNRDLESTIADYEDVLENKDGD